MSRAARVLIALIAEAPALAHATAISPISVTFGVSLAMIGSLLEAASTTSAAARDLEQ